MDSQEWSAYCADCNKWLNRKDSTKEDMLFMTYQHLKESSFRMHIVYIGYRIDGSTSYSNYLAFRFNHRVGQVADLIEDAPGTQEDKIRHVLQKIECLENRTS